MHDVLNRPENNIKIIPSVTEPDGITVKILGRNKEVRETPPCKQPCYKYRNEWGPSVVRSEELKEVRLNLFPGTLFSYQQLILIKHVYF